MPEYIVRMFTESVIRLSLQPTIQGIYRQIPTSILNDSRGCSVPVRVRPSPANSRVSTVDRLKSTGVFVCLPGLGVE